MMQSYFFLVHFVLLFSGFMFCSNGFQFIVGGKGGWTLNPSENYNSWAERMRFQVNDTLLFNYKKGSDSVLMVSKDDYNQCNTANPNAKLEDGKSVFKLDRSGPFFFISGNNSNCDHGQKLIVVVLAIRNKNSSPPTHQAGSPTDAPGANSTSAPHPRHHSFAASGWNPSVVLVSMGSVVISVCLGGFLY